MLLGSNYVVQCTIVYFIMEFPRHNLAFVCHFQGNLVYLLIVLVVQAQQVYRKSSRRSKILSDLCSSRDDSDNAEYFDLAEEDG